MEKEKLYRYASNSISDREEIEEIIDWIEASEENRKDFITIKNLLAYLGLKNNKPYLKLRSKRKLYFIRPLMKYAAIFIIAFLTGSITVHLLNRISSQQNTVWNEIHVPNGHRTEIVLSDQTHIWLNSGSRLSYPSDFNGKTREVRLNGEAYLDVSKNPDKAFIVKTSLLKVNVTGTKFNVKALNNSPMAYVTLVEGEVELENNEGKLLAVLSPDEHASYNSNKGTIGISKVDTELHTSWIEGCIYFKDETLGDIATKLENSYNVKIIFDDETIRDLMFTGAVLTDKPINQFIEVLKFMANIDYYFEPNDKNMTIIHFKYGKQ